MATRMCDVCRIRPAVVTVGGVVPRRPEVKHLCEIPAAEAGVGRSTFGGRSPGGRKFFEDFSTGSSTRNPAGRPVGAG